MNLERIERLKGWSEIVASVAVAAGGVATGALTFLVQKARSAEVSTYSALLHMPLPEIDPATPVLAGVTLGAIATGALLLTEGRDHLNMAATIAEIDAIPTTKLE